VPLTLSNELKKQTFFFDGFRLVVSPANYLENVDERDNYWMFFMQRMKCLQWPFRTPTRTGKRH